MKKISNGDIVETVYLDGNELKVAVHRVDFKSCNDCTFGHLDFIKGDKPDRGCTYKCVSRRVIGQVDKETPFVTTVKN